MCCERFLLRMRRRGSAASTLTNGEDVVPRWVCTSVRNVGQRNPALVPIISLRNDLHGKEHDRPQTHAKKRKPSKTPHAPMRNV